MICKLWFYSVSGMANLCLNLKSMFEEVIRMCKVCQNLDPHQNFNLPGLYKQMDFIPHLIRRFRNPDWSSKLIHPLNPPS